MNPLAISSLLLFAVAFCKSEEVATPSVDVELKILDPNGSVVVNKPAHIKFVEQENFSPKAAPIVVTTDSGGVARFKIPAAVYRLEVSVPGVGYSGTGELEFFTGKGRIARPHLPQLAPYGSISGKLSPGACGAHAKVFLSNNDNVEEKERSVTPGPGP